MKIRRLPLICGGAALFALAGCDTTNGGGQDAAAQGDGAVSDDTGGSAAGDVGPAVDTGGGADAGSWDAGSSDGWAGDGGSWDGGSADGGSWDGGAIDGGSWDGGAIDGGSFDAGKPDDAGSFDVWGGDAWGLDGWSPGDGGAIDAGSPDTTDPTAPQLGEPCDMGYTAWCDAAMTPTLFCGWTETGQAWIPYVDDGNQLCWCDEATSPGITYCAVPGFVGLDRAGRTRKARTLRSLRRAA